VTWEIWRILARVTKKYIEESFNINEGTGVHHDFKTIESILYFPFTSKCTHQENEVSFFVVYK